MHIKKGNKTAELVLSCYFHYSCKKEIYMHVLAMKYDFIYSVYDLNAY